MFYALDEFKVIDYLKKTPVYKDVFGSREDLQATDLAEGNINLTFRVCSKQNPKERSVLIKQALPYARKYPEFKVPQRRAILESEMLKLEHKHCPGLVPKVYLFDESMYAIVMEDLNNHIIMRYGLMKQIRYERFAEHIGTFLARTLFYTSDLYLSSDKKKEMVSRFINPVMCKVTEDLIFTEPFIRHEHNHWTPQLTPQVEEIQADETIRAEALELKRLFMTSAEALIHGDLHTGSIMVNENETKVIDPEFGYFGPMGFDIGAVLGNLVLSYCSQHYHASNIQDRREYRKWLLNTIRGIWKMFETEFHTLINRKINDQWPSEQYKKSYILRLLRETAGFAAAKTMRRIIGIAHVPDMWEIPEDRSRAAAETLALEIARSWMLNRQYINSVDDLIHLIEEAKPHQQVEV